MATKGRDVGSSGKEKRGASPKPLQTGIPHTRRTTKQSNPDSTDKDHSAPISAKQVPSYLKPTISSLGDSSRSSKKDDSTHAHSVNRRRSFDKPPSPSLIQKALRSPSPKDRAVRSLPSTPAKPTATPKAFSDRATKTSRVAKSQTPSPTSSKPTSARKTTTNSTSKKEATASSASARKAPSVPEKTEKLNIESEKEEKEEKGEEDKKSLVHAVTVKDVDTVIEIPSIVLHVDVANTESSSEQDDKVKPGETSTAVGDQDASTSASTQENSAEDKFEDKENKDEIRNTHTEEDFADETKVEARDTEVEESVTGNPIIEEAKAPSAEDSIDDQDKPIIEKDHEGSQTHADHEETQTHVDHEESQAHADHEGSQAHADQEGSQKHVDDEESQKHADHEGSHEQADEGSEKDADEGSSHNQAEQGSEKYGDDGSHKHTDEKREEHVEEESHKYANEGSQKEIVEEVKKVEENVTPKRPAAAGGKKDPQVYNDVIEETASKLLEKRKNKVRALVGAFETVISLQEPEP